MARHIVGFDEAVASSEISLWLVVAVGATLESTGSVELGGVPRHQHDLLMGKFVLLTKVNSRYIA